MYGSNDYIDILHINIHWVQAITIFSPQTKTELLFDVDYTSVLLYGTRWFPKTGSKIFHYSTDEFHALVSIIFHIWTWPKGILLCGKIMFLLSRIKHLSADLHLLFVCFVFCQSISETVFKVFLNQLISRKNTFDIKQHSLKTFWSEIIKVWTHFSSLSVFSNSDIKHTHPWLQHWVSVTKIN